MITFEEALNIIRSQAKQAETEHVALEICSGRVLAENVYSDMDMPPFNKSAVDGYACRWDDLGEELEVLEVIAAGVKPRFAISKGQCSKLMTGGMVPEGADTVLMVEETETSGPGKIRFCGEKTSSNICKKGEDICKGDLVLKQGTLIRAQEVAVLASVGKALPLVYKQFRIGVITTGDELVEPQQHPGPAQIRNSNAWQLIAQVTQAGAIPTYYGIAADSEELTLDLIRKAASENTIVILTGGISAGDFDFVPKVIEQAGYTICFRSLAVQPGKPSIFAVRDNSYLFALPGNPVSSFVQFELLVRHLMNLSVNSEGHSKELSLPIGFDYRRRNTGRKAFVPVRLQRDGSAGALEYHGSAHIHSYIHADAIMIVEIGIPELLKGEMVHVRLL